VSAPTDEELGRAAYEAFQKAIGVDSARLAWDNLEIEAKSRRSPVREKWIAVAKAVAAKIASGR